MNKYFFTLLTILIVTSNCFGQSDSLKVAYKQVCATLNDYKFTSEDCHYDGETLSITLKLQEESFVFTINDNAHARGENGEARPGVKIITLPIKDATFNVEYGSLYFRNIVYQENESGYYYKSIDNGIELSYKGKKEILEDYEFEGSKLTLEKLSHELYELKRLVLKENFTGSLGDSSTATKTTKQVVKPQKTTGKPAPQAQPAQRKRIPTGN